MRETRVVLDRSGLTESEHRVRVAVWREGRLAAAAGDVDSPCYLRSAAKPVQALASVVTGATDRFGMTDRELALACGSHGGEPFHIETAAGLLERIGLREDDLLCGTHAPGYRPAADELAAARGRPSPLHNNCSGKHAAMLACCVAAGWDTGDYTSAVHPLQRMNVAHLARLAGVAPEDVGLGVDGCSVPVLALPMRHTARLVAAWTSPDLESVEPPLAGACRRVAAAMGAAPEMIGGTGRTDTDVIRVTRGRVLTKVGGEGVWAIGVAGHRLGIVVKADDGAFRAAYRTGLAVLRSLGLVSDAEWDELSVHHRPERLNHRGKHIGYVTVIPSEGVVTETPDTEESPS